MRSYAPKRFSPHRMGSKTQAKRFDHGKRRFRAGRRR